MEIKPMQNRSSVNSLSATVADPPAIFLVQINAPAPVWGYDGERLGLGRMLALDQGSGQSLCLLVGRGRALRSLRPVPWAAVRYDSRLQAWLADVTAPLFMQGPGWSSAAGRARACVQRAHIYYDVYYEMAVRV
jgi:hypothetical protein